MPELKIVIRRNHRKNTEENIEKNTEKNAFNIKLSNHPIKKAADLCMKSALEIPKMVRKASLSFELAVGRKSLNTCEFNSWLNLLLLQNYK